MCGIAGILTSNPPSRELLLQMAAKLAHRGPDDEGIWLDPYAGIGLVNALAALGVEQRLSPEYLTELAMDMLDPGMAAMAGLA